MPPINDKNRSLGASDVPDKLGPSKIEGLPTNKTLVVTKLTEAPEEGVKLQEIRSMPEVFATYQPSIGVPVTGVEGEVTEANIRFEQMADFGNDESMINQVPELRQLRDLLAFDQDLLDEVSRNESLRKDLADPAKRQKLVESLKHYLEELNKMD